MANHTQTNGDANMTTTTNNAIDASSTKAWAKTMTWNAHHQAALKKAACLSGYLAQASAADQVRQGRITAGQLHAIEQVSGLLERAMVLLGCTSALDGIEDDLDAAFAAAGVDDSGGLVDVDDACPRCGERDQDSLVWQDDATIHCTNCGTRYDPDAQQDAAASQPQ